MSKQVPSLRQFFGSHQFKLSKAGEGNRTLVFSLEGCGSTVELHPHANTERAAPSMLNHYLYFNPKTFAPHWQVFQIRHFLFCYSSVLAINAVTKWGVQDSNLRRHCHQIYSLTPLTARETPPDPSCSSIPWVVSQFD